MTDVNNKWGNLEQYEDASSSIPTLKVLDEITMNGNTGEFKIKYLTRPKIQENGREVYQKEILQDKVLEVIIIRANRRKLLMLGNKGSIKQSTSEYTLKDKYVTLYDFETSKSKKVLPVNIAGENTGFRSRQIIYAIYKESLVRIVLKGGQIKSDDKSITDYFDYIYGVQGEDKIYKRVTKISPVAYTSSLGVNYTLDFKNVSPLEDDSIIETVKDYVISVGENIKKHDDYHSDVKNIPAKKDDVPTVQLEDEEDDVETGGVNPDDIPF